MLNQFYSNFTPSTTIKTIFKRPWSVWLSSSFSIWKKRSQQWALQVLHIILLLHVLRVICSCRLIATPLTFDNFARPESRFSRDISPSLLRDRDCVQGNSVKLINARRGSIRETRSLIAGGRFHSEDSRATINVRAGIPNSRNYEGYAIVTEYRGEN